MSQKNYIFENKSVHTIETLNNNIETYIINNGHTSPSFKPTIGIRQGC